MKRALVWCAAILGIVFVALAIYYWVTPAASLPTFLPGYEPGVAATHFKHGLVCLIVGAALLIFVWFMTGPKRR
jgi:formate/nitrite transporter FocA (FNT family)